MSRHHHLVLIVIAMIGACLSSGTALEAGTIVQGAADSYVAFEAESFESMAGNRWRLVDLTTGYDHPYTTGQPVTSVILPSSSNVSGGAAILQEFTEASPSGTGIVTYEIDFQTAGTYRFYIRQTAFQEGHYAGYGNEDSFHRPADFDVNPTSATPYHTGGSYTEGNYGWRDDFSYTVTTPGVHEFRISFRERGQSLDRIVFSTDASLTATDLDALVNSTLSIDDTHFTDTDAGDSNWTTPGNWDNGVPTLTKNAFIGDGKTANLVSAAQAAYSLAIGHDNATLSGNGTLNQTGGGLTVLNELSIGRVDTNTASADGRTGSYTITGDGTLAVGTEATGRANLYVGYHTVANSNANAVGTLDLSGADQFNAYLDSFLIGVRTTSGSNATASGTVTLAANNNIDATTIMISDTNMWINPPTSTLSLGANNTIKTDLWTVGGYRGEAEVDFAAPGGTLNLSGSSGVAADLRVGYSRDGTGNPTNAVMDLTGGTFNATLDELIVAFKGHRDGSSPATTASLSFDAGTVTANSVVIGQGDNDGTGDGRGLGMLNMGGGSLTAGSIGLAVGTSTGSTGTFNQTGGTVDVTGSVTGGVGTSTVNADGGTMNVTGDLKIDTLRVGYEGLTATVTAGGDVEIGASGDLDIGRRATTASGTTRGTLDLSSADSVTLDLDNLRVGTVGANSPGNTYGTLSLSTTGLNTISATEITVGDSRAGYTPTVTGIVHLGGENVIEADTVYVGRQKAQGEVDIAPGGTLTLSGPGGTKATLRVGYNDTTTGSAVSRGTLDLSGGTFNATLGELTIGYHDYPWSGTTGKVEAEMTLDAGNVTADTVTVGRGNPPGGSAVAGGGGIGTLNINGGALVAQTISLGAGGSTRADGTINLSGGTLTATLIDDGIGTANFNFTGGTLSVGTFGFDLVQDGGTLAPGNSPGTTTVNGDYTMNAGTLEIEIEGTTPGTGYDQLIVNGAVDLAGDLSVLVSGYSTTPDDLFWILLNDGTDPISGQFASFPEKAPVRIDGRTFYVYYDADFDSLAFSGGNDVLLTSVPEPSTVAMLLGLSLLGLLGYMRRRK